MKPEIVIREAAPSELPEIEHLVKTSYQEFASELPEAVWKRWMRNVGETLRAPGGIVLVAETGGRIGGAVTFFPDAGQAHQGHWPAGTGAIRLLAVRPDSRGQGSGSRLTQACLDRARELKINTIFLYTGTFMLAARHLYEKLGFKRAPEFDGEHGPLAYRLKI
ncbi:MAG: GNAT family N-acetyltransferase [Deltaproteobacteria bacterium]|jgi:GNAT superfamily N-acetyltransferase